MPLSAQSVSSIRAAIDNIAGSKVAGAAFVAVDRSGNELIAHYAGKREHSALGAPVDRDTVFWIASCTKLITTVAAMQLVEQGRLGLDDSKKVEQIAPELAKVKVLKGVKVGPDGKRVAEWEEKKKGITLRMLLDHTAGFGYTFFNEKLRDYSFPVGFDEFSGDYSDILNMPLVNQPGSRFEYGINLDWVGILVERVTQQSLNDYCREHIFAPLGIEHISFFPDEHMKANLASMHQLNADGSFRPRDHLHRRPLAVPAEGRKDILNSGGAGCFAKPHEYVKILAALLNDGTSPTTGKQILSKATVEQMFTNSIPQFPDYARQPIPAAKLELTNAIPELYPQEDNPAQGWGLSFMLTQAPGATGRGANTAWWAGLANLFWWADRANGVAGMIATQMLPFADPNVLGAWAQAEAAVYQGLKV